MGTFFHGRRPKIGVVMLVMACVLMVGWIRSHIANDRLLIWLGWSDMHLGSRNGSIELDYITSVSGEWMGSGRIVRWNSSRLTPNRVQHNPLESFDEKWQMTYGGFDFASARYKGASGKMFRWRRTVVPYWSIVTPLTLFSSYLLLSKSRMAKPSTESSRRHISAPKIF